MQSNSAEKKRIQEEMEKFKAQVEKDKQVNELKKNRDLIENTSGIALDIENFNSE